LEREMVSLSMRTGRRTASSPVFYNISQAQETSLIGRTPPGSACTGSPVRVNGYKSLLEVVAKLMKIEVRLTLIIFYL
jgi:hypothetical protein